MYINVIYNTRISDVITFKLSREVHRNDEQEKHDQGRRYSCTHVSINRCITSCITSLYSTLVVR